MNLKKNLLTIAIASSLAACGGGGGGSSPSSSGTVSGSVVKGLVVGAKVTAKDANGTEVGTATTNENGEYSITLDPSYTGGPIEIEIEGQDNSTMKCDVVGGCDPDGDPTTDNTVAFGQTIPLTSAFKLKAVVPNATGTVSTHVTALTDMAAKLAKLNSGAGNALNADAVSGANSQVAQLFGLSSGDDLIQQKPIDITDPDVIRDATVAQLRNALYSAAILGAVLKSDRPSDDIGDALEAFSNDFAENGGQLVDKDDSSNKTVTSKKDILIEVDALLKEDSVSGAIASTDDGIRSKTDDDQAETETKPVDDRTTAAPSPEAASPDIQQALAMISDMRDLAYALGARQNNTASTDMQALTEGAEAFANELSIAGDATGPGAQYLAKALGMAAVAMAQAGAEYALAVEQAQEDSNTPIPSAVLVQGIQVIITVPDASKPLEVTLAVDKAGLNVDPNYAGTDEINLVDVSLSFALVLTGVQEAIDSLTLTYGTDTNGNPTAQETGAGTLALNASLEGTLTGPTAKLSILNSEAQASQVSVNVQQLAFSNLHSEQALVTVDGSSDDWNTNARPWWNWSNSVMDETGDATGTAPGTDITEFLYRASDLQLAFGLRLSDGPVYPHTADQSDSRYVIAMVPYTDDSCNDELGGDAGVPKKISVRNVARGDTVFSQVRTFDIADVEVGSAIALPSTSSGDLVELLLPQSALPESANSVRAFARVRWFDGDATFGELDSTEAVCIPLRQGEHFVQDNFAATFGIQPSSVSLDLNAKLEQLTVETPARFEGGFSVSLTDLDYDGSETEDRSLTEASTNSGSSFTETHSFTLSETLRFTELNMTLSGTFSRGSDSFDALFDATVGGSGFSITEEENDSWLTTYDADGNRLSNSGTGFNPTTTTTGFVSVDAMLKFEAIINGVSNSPVVVQLDVDRTTETTGSAGLKITQGTAGKFLELQAQLAKGADSTKPDDIVPTSAILTNQDGITIDLLEADTTRTGKITKGSGTSLKQLGTVTEESGTVIFRLNDGSTNRIESL